MIDDSNALISCLTTVFILIIYLVQSVSLYKMAQRANLRNPWFAFIPVLNSILMLHLIDYSGWWLLLLILLCLIPIVGGFVALIFEICIMVKLARNFELGILGQILIVFFGVFVLCYIVVSGKHFIGYTRYSNN